MDVESTGTKCIVPLEKTSREKEEGKGYVFTYDKQTDTYTCPQGKNLHCTRETSNTMEPHRTGTNAKSAKVILSAKTVPNQKQAGYIIGMPAMKKLTSTRKI